LRSLDSRTPPAVDAGPPPSADAAARRVALVSFFNPLTGPHGGAAYLGSVARALRAIGRRVSFIVIEPAAWGWPATRLDPAMTGDFDEVWGARALRVGDRLVALDALTWIDALARRARRAPPRPALAEGVASAAALAAAAARIKASGCEAVIAWRPFAVPIFDLLPREVRRIFLLDDVYALRARSFEAAGLPVPFPRSLIDREREGMRRADVNLAIQGDEAAFARSVNPRAPALVAPHACEIVEGPLAGAREPVCLFVGAAQTAANLDGLGWFLGRVWPLVRAARPDARLRVCGTAARAARAGDSVEPVGFVPDLAAEYAAAALAIVPLTYGSGLKIKLVEALASGAPVVATPVGAQGATDAPPEALTVADTPEGFAAGVVARLGAASAVGPREAARAYAERRFSPRALQRTLAEALG
jgi:succinoglycan biosynthesis protein ExoO